MDVDLEGPWPLRLQNLSLKAGSDDGKSFNAVESVKARLNVPTTKDFLTLSDPLIMTVMYPVVMSPD